MRKIAVAGAGLVGSLLAYLLRKQGYEVEVFEKRPDPRKEILEGGRSINLVITSRGLKALETAGLLKKIKALTVPVYGRRIHPKQGESFFQPYGRDTGECNYSVSRLELNKALIDECEKSGVNIHFSQEVKELDLKSKTLILTSGTKDYDLLFATDGAGSPVRKSLAKQRPDVFTEKTEWLSSGYKELSMPAPNSFEKNSLHIWPRATHMMMGLANLDGSFTMTLYLPNENHPFSFKDIKSQNDINNLFENEFASALPFIPDYLKQFESHPQGNLGTVRLNKWVFEDSVALLGDAAHAIVPFFGQGMNLGFEDCSVLLQMMKRYTRWHDILENFEKERLPNATAIADMALENFVEMRDKVSDPQFQARKKIEALIEKEFPELYRSRYGMITYTLIPYKVAQEAGLRQNRLLDSFSNETDLTKIKQVLEADFYPWLRSQGFTTARYTPED